MKNDNPNTKLIEVRNLVVAARRQLEKADAVIAHIVVEIGGNSTPPCAETLVAIREEAGRAKEFSESTKGYTWLLMSECQSVRDIRQHDIELTQKDASDE